MSGLVVALLLGADGGIPLADEGALACVRALSAARPKLEAVSLSARLAPTLKVIAASCAAVDAALAAGAGRAANQSRALRSATLAAAQSRCAVPAPTAAAQTLGAACAPAPGDPQGPILRDLDAGTFAWLLALRARLTAIARLDADADAVLSSLALAAALEGEQLRERSAPK